MARVNCIARPLLWRQHHGMRPLFLCAPVALGLLVGCAPLQTYYKPGVALGTLERDTRRCEVQALRDVPATTRIRREPPIFVPGRRICDAQGQCSTTPGYFVPGRVETYDPNAGLRLRVERQCMADKGYAPVSIPQCPDAVAAAAPPGATTRLPQLTENSCVIRNSDGSFRIVTRG